MVIKATITELGISGPANRGRIQAWGTTAVRKPNFGFAWLFLCLSMALHAWDEATHSFLTYYNATVLTLYGHFAFFPRIDLEYQNWVELWVLVIIAGLILTPWAFRNVRWMRWLGFATAALVLLVGAGFVAAQIYGGFLGSVQFDGAAPGVYTTPLLLVAGGYLYWRLRRCSREVEAKPYRPSKG